MTDVVYFLRVLTKDKYQLAIEIDSSSGHLARAPDALHKRSLKWGGKQLPMRSSVVNENCLDLIESLPH